jgi:hypothetical protein
VIRVSRERNAGLASADGEAQGLTSMNSGLSPSAGGGLVTGDIAIGRRVVIFAGA